MTLPSTIQIQSEIIPEMVARLMEQFDPLRVVLFGSYARGEAAWGSDVDLLVVVESVEDKRGSGSRDDVGASGSGSAQGRRRDHA